MACVAGQQQRLWRSSGLGQQTWDRHRQQQTAGRRSSRKASATEGTRHEGGVEPLALSCSTDLKSAPRTVEDHPDQIAVIVVIVVIVVITAPLHRCRCVWCVRREGKARKVTLCKELGQPPTPRRRSRTPSTLVLHGFEVRAPYRRGSS